ncbi:MAG: hypothetical protein ABI793_06695 [Flavobacterium sp.]
MNFQLISCLSFKKIVFIFLLLLFSNKNFSQKVLKDSIAINQNFKTFEQVEAKPEFQGGIEKFYKFVGSNFKISDKEPSGKIIAKFIIEKDGRLSNIEIVKNEVGIFSGVEFIRVLKICPKWIPGSDNGVPVRVLFNVPITVQTAK